MPGGEIEQDRTRREVSELVGLTKNQAEKGLEAFEYVVKSALRRNETVRITGFGTFKVRDRAARRGRNPQTGAPVKIKASKALVSQLVLG